MDLNGNFGMYSINPKRPKVPKRIEKKILRHLVKTNFLYFTIDPFMEFDPIYNNISMDLENALVVNEFLNNK